MRQNGHFYRTLDGLLLSLSELSKEERQTLAEIQRAYKRNPDWCQFTNWWRKKVLQLYRDLPPGEHTSKTVYLVGEDLEGRLGVAQGYLRQPDYRDELDDLITQNFRSRYAFCRATGLDQGFLSRLLRKSTNISVERLNRALLRIGWQLTLTEVPQRESKRAAR